MLTHANSQLLASSFGMPLATHLHTLHFYHCVPSSLRPSWCLSPSQAFPFHMPFSCFPLRREGPFSYLRLCLAARGAQSMLGFNNVAPLLPISTAMIQLIAIAAVSLSHTQHGKHQMSCPSEDRNHALGIQDLLIAISCL